MDPVILTIILGVLFVVFFPLWYFIGYLLYGAVRSLYPSWKQGRAEASLYKPYNPYKP